MCVKELLGDVCLDRFECLLNKRAAMKARLPSKTVPNPAPDSPPERLRIGSIVCDERLQFRPLERGTVKKYASAYRLEQPLPPVSVANLEGVFILTDGWHRVAALESLGEIEVDAVVQPAASVEEVRWLAARANLTHGLPLKSKEYREVFRAYIRARNHRRNDKSFKSYREIAAEIGGARGYTTIRNWMQKDFPSVFRAMRGYDEPPADGVVPQAVELPAIAIEALKDARAAMPAVTDLVDQQVFMGVLEEIVEMARAKGWERSEF